VWRRIVAEGRPLWPRIAEELATEVRKELAQWLGSPDGLGDIVLTPSGTDAELLAIHVALRAGAKSLLNVVVAPDEVGSGTLRAAAGYHFARRTPSGARSQPGVAIDPQLVARVQSVGVNARDHLGEVRKADDIREEISKLSLPVLEAGGHVIIHGVAHSKTGIRTPPDAAIEALQSLSTRVHVVIDAAQGRLSKSSIARHLAHGRMVLFTGSKFYGGPTFSGALFVPRSYADTSLPLPIGYGDYFTRAEMPSSWKQEREHLGRRINLGLILRWKAALAEMNALDQVPTLLQEKALLLFADAVREAFGSSPSLRLVDAVCPSDPICESEFPLEDVTSVFNFSVSDAGGATLPPAALRRVHGWLNRSISAFLNLELTEEETKIFDQVYHLGQPVMISPGAEDRKVAVLRVALGAPMIRSLIDPDRAVILPQRELWIRAHLVDLARKIELILRHRDLLLQSS
jgi:hypothetical protein